MTEEFRNLEADAAKLRPRGLRPEVQARLLERLREEESSMRLEADLRRLTPAPLSENARQHPVALEADLSRLVPAPLSENARRQTVAAVAAVRAPRHWGRWLAMAAAAAAVVVGGFLVLNFQADKVLDGGGLQVANNNKGPLQLIGVTRLPKTAKTEFADADTIRTYVINQQDDGIMRLPNGSCVRRVSYDMVDEVRRPSQQVPGRYCIERVPRREVMYVAVPAE
jgi:hypothetical protein